MDLGEWVWAVAGAWLVLSCVVGLLLGLVVRRRDAWEAPGRYDPVASVEELEAMFASSGRPSGH
jgi:hypothetical protein